MQHDLSIITRAISLNCILTSSEIMPEFEGEKVGEYVKLNEKGAILKNKLLNKFDYISENYIRYLIFQCLFSDDFLIDFEETNFEGILNVLHKAIIQQEIKFPWLYDNILYNKYYNTVRMSLDEMSYETVVDFLKDTPQGVYQFADLVVGPFGIMLSNGIRKIMPKNEVLLWHCPNPGCDEFHGVSFERNKKLVDYKVRRYLNDNGYERSMDISEYYGKETIYGDTIYDDFHLGQLPHFLGNCIDSDEIKLIINKLIENNQEKIRNKIGGIKKLSGSAEKISSMLTKPECLQLILLLEDNEIVSALEELIDENQICIPPTEIRCAQFMDETAANYVKVICECSKYGIRTNLIHSKRIGIKRLEILLKNLYSSEAELKELDWILRNVKLGNQEESHPYKKLSIYIYKEDIREILRNLVLCRKEKVDQTLEFLKFGSFDNSMPDYQNYLINKILWKLGFNINHFQNEIILFWEKYTNLASEINKNYYDSEIDEDSIRSKAIVFFVELEALLQRSFSFMCWVLLSDHYKDTNFSFKFEDAKRLVYEYINGYKLNDNTVLSLSENGKDTLYPLIEGFNALGSICEKLLLEKDKYKKDIRLLPAEFDQNLIFFPFLHSKLILDLPNEYSKNIIQELKNISTRLKNIEVCSIRNSTSHHRESCEFPGKEKLSKFCEEIKRAIERFEELGIYPLVYTGKKVVTDSFGRRSLELKNYKGKVVSFNEVGDNAHPIPDFTDPQIIVPIIKFRQHEDGMRFFLEESSNYKDMWHGFPKRANWEE